MTFQRAMPIICALVLFGTSMSRAVQPDEVLPDPALETRARTLSQELRCLVCQNQSIDDSDAPLARDLRILLRERLKSGDSDRQAVDFLVARYGEFVLLRPRLAWHTVLLWLGPFGVLLAGIAALFLLARSRSKAGPEGGDGLAPEESARLARLTEKETSNRK